MVAQSLGAARAVASGLLLLAVCGGAAHGRALMPDTADEAPMPRLDALAAVTADDDASAKQEGGSAGGPRRVGETIAFADGKYEMAWVRNISIPHVGYSFLPAGLPAGTMLATGFDATPFIGKDGVYRLDVAAADPGLVQLTDKIDWPNFVEAVPASVFGFEAAIVGAGFLVPSHGTGGVWVVDQGAERQPVKVTKDKSGWFYHRGVLHDFNADGLPDILTCRCTDSVFPWSGKGSQLLWLEHPPNGTDPLSGAAWQEHILADPGPDFVFDPAPEAVLKGAAVGAVGAEYIAERVAYYHQDVAGGNVTTRVIDDDSGPGFGATFVDVNGDGATDLLVTNHLNQNGSVFAYSWDGDLRAAPVTKHVLATGFSAVSTSVGTAAPGAAMAFHACRTEGKPYVFVSEDNGNAIWLLVPRSQEPSDWTYDKQRLAFLGADIGQFSIADIDGDGCVEIFVPAYDNGDLVQYTVKRSGGVL